MRLLELAAGGFPTVVMEGDLLALIVLPMLWVLLGLIRLLGLTGAARFPVVGVDDFLVLIELPMLCVLLELIRLLGLTVARFPAAEFIPVGFLVTEGLPDGLWALKVLPGRRAGARPVVTLLGGLPGMVLLGE